MPQTGDPEPNAVLDRIRDGWRRCPDGVWRIPGDWPALAASDPPFSNTVSEQARSENRSGLRINRLQDHPPFSGAVPRTAEEIIRAGDLGKCGIRELYDLAREMSLECVARKGPLLAAIRADARRRGWLLMSPVPDNSESF